MTMEKHMVDELTTFKCVQTWRGLNNLALLDVRRALGPRHQWRAYAVDDV